MSDILASRLNFDVIAFRGNTRGEMMVIGLTSLILTAALPAIISKLLLGLFMVGIGLSFPLAIPVGWGIATLFQKLKDGKPKGYLKQRFLLWQEKSGIKKSPFIRHSGQWCTRRLL